MHNTLNCAVYNLYLLSNEILQSLTSKCEEHAGWYKRINCCDCLLWLNYEREILYCWNLFCEYASYAVHFHSFHVYDDDIATLEYDDTMNVCIKVFVLFLCLKVVWKVKKSPEYLGYFGARGRGIFWRLLSIFKPYICLFDVICVL